MVFHVYVDGVTGTTPDAASVLAEAMAAHYGVPAAELLARIVRGAFRVKANVDLATADAYARELAGLGARVRIEPADGASHAPAMARTRTPLPEAAPSASRTFSRSSLPPQPERAAPRSSLSPEAARPSPEIARTTSRSSLPPQPAAPSLPRTSSRPTASSTSALSASPASAPGKVVRPPTSEVLGALAAFDEGSLSLASLDGSEPIAPVLGASAFAPTNAYAPPPVPSPTRARGTPPQVDLFAPPSETEELAVEIASDELSYHARKRSADLEVAPPQGANGSGEFGAVTGAARNGASSSNASLSTSGLGASLTSASSTSNVTASTSGVTATSVSSSRNAASGPRATSASASTWLADPLHRLAPPRTRLAAGVLLAILLGFIPADIVATMRDHRMQREIDAKVVAVQSAATDQDSYAALDRFRATQLAAKHSRHRAIVLGSLAIWAIVGGAVAAGWFRGIRWDRYA